MDIIELLSWKVRQRAEVENQPDLTVDEKRAAATNQKRDTETNQAKATQSTITVHVSGFTLVPVTSY